MGSLRVGTMEIEFALVNYLSERMKDEDRLRMHEAKD